LIAVIGPLRKGVAMNGLHQGHRFHFFHIAALAKAQRRLSEWSHRIDLIFSCNLAVFGSFLTDLASMGIQK
jgi:hypothetical protein